MQACCDVVNILPYFFWLVYTSFLRKKRLQKTWRRFLRSMLNKKQKKPFVFLNNELIKVNHCLADKIVYLLALFA